jgi:hypothetical protein
MAEKNERFEQVYAQRSSKDLQIWVDRETGVNYLLQTGTGLTPLLDRDGKPVISPIQR